MIAGGCVMTWGRIHGQAARRAEGSAALEAIEAQKALEELQVCVDGRSALATHA